MDDNTEHGSKVKMAKINGYIKMYTTASELQAFKLGGSILHPRALKERAYEIVGVAVRIVINVLIWGGTV